MSLQLEMKNAGVWNENFEGICKETSVMDTILNKVAVF